MAREIEFGTGCDGTVLRLPVEPSEKLAIVGLSGSGKSFLAARIAEEMMMCGVKVGIFDPVGTWWSLRVGSDGDPAGGFPIRIYGGQRMDEQLKQPREAAEKFVLSHNSAIFDLSAVTFETLHWWTAAFLNRIGELGPTITRPSHFIFEEAPIFAPQTGSLSRFQRDCKVAMSQCARVFRNFGVGSTSISQRAAVLDKTVLSSAGSLIALRVAAKADRKALADWSASNSTSDTMKEAIEKVGIAPVGSGMIFSPSWAKLEGVWFQALKRTTFHCDARHLEFNRSVQLCEPPVELGASAPPRSLLARGRKFLESAIARSAVNPLF